MSIFSTSYTGGLGSLSKKECCAPYLVLLVWRDGSRLELEGGIVILRIHIRVLVGDPVPF